MLQAKPKGPTWHIHGMNIRMTLDELDRKILLGEELQKIRKKIWRII